MPSDASPPVAALEEPAEPQAPAASSPYRGHGRRRAEKNIKQVDVVHDLTDAEKEALGGGGNLVLIQGRRIKIGT
jgi:hypothetical protein